jgi:hypothetical protein
MVEEVEAGASGGDDKHNQIVRRDYGFHRGGHNSGGGVVAFRPSHSVRQRVAELVERSNEGSISIEDQSELEDYLQLEHFMIMANARARQGT